ncbi:jg2837 [Pararge aegeria aegeria]|uniref:Jg2837 protein n=1 Tax=Pararge aegeria aegeria TaxID=348720 RepID=A0A8S4QKM3_9NEOP|nr:jg2837 [Pararge aegeria aegeria]
MDTTKPRRGAVVMPDSYRLKPHGVRTHRLVTASWERFRTQPQAPSQRCLQRQALLCENIINHLTPSKEHQEHGVVPLNSRTYLRRAIESPYLSPGDPSRRGKTFVVRQLLRPTLLRRSGLESNKK